MVIKKDWKFVWMIVPLFFYLYASSQPPASTDTLRPYRVGKIFISGNKKTKNYIIERELAFKPGDTVSLHDLVDDFRTARERLINTHLFNDVVIYLKEFRGYDADIQIVVKERWYIFPVPYFRPVDRNLSAWADKHYSLSRVNYGGKFTHFNFTGRNDQLTAWLITGYAQQFELYYNQPYADKTLKHGFGGGFTYAKMKEVDALTLGDKQYFINSDTIPYAGKYLSEQFSVSVRYFYRPGLKVRHFVGLSVNSIRIDSAVAVYNPHYFDNGKLKVLFPDLTYRFNYTDVDYIPYPLNGILFETGLTRRGLITKDIDFWQLHTKLTRAWPIGRKLWFSLENTNVLKWPLHQPFYNQSLLGYGDFYLRGLDRYVVDGTAGFLVRNTVHRELFNFSVPFIRRSQSHDRIPFRIYATLFGDCGYAYNEDFKYNSLVNRMLYTGGFGLAIVTFYDLNFRLDYSFNQLGQNGLFLHIRNDF